jgi:hypothetical protein
VLHMEHCAACVSPLPVPASQRRLSFARLTESIVSSVCLQNLLVNTETHQLKLCDFGSAKVGYVAAWGRDGRRNNAFG